MKALFVFKASQGKQDFGSEFNEARLRQYLKEHDGQLFGIVPKTAVVTDTMRGYCFGALIPFLRQIDRGAWAEMTDDQVYEMLKKQFNYFEAFNPFTKRKERYGQSIMSKSVANQKAKEFISRIDDWVTEQYDQTIPDAEEYKRFVRDNPQLITQ